MEFLTLVSHARLSAAVLFLFPGVSVANEVEIAARALGANSFSDSSTTSTFMAFIVLAFVLLFIIVVTLWPQKEGEGSFQRQRKFARVNDLFFKVKARRCSSAETQIILRSFKDLKFSELPDPDTTLTLVGLSFGGANLVCMELIYKGDIIILDLSSLPDFPALNAKVPAKVVWVRAQHDEKEHYYLVGLKFLGLGSDENEESLRLYLNFLMDDALT